MDRWYEETCVSSSYKLTCYNINTIKKVKQQIESLCSNYMNRLCQTGDPVLSKQQAINQSGVKKDIPASSLIINKTLGPTACVSTK